MTHYFLLIMLVLPPEDGIPNRRLVSFTEHPDRASCEAALRKYPSPASGYCQRDEPGLREFLNRGKK